LQLPDEARGRQRLQADDLFVLRLDIGGRVIVDLLVNLANGELCIGLRLEALVRLVECVLRQMLYVDGLARLVVQLFLQLDHHFVAFATGLGLATLERGLDLESFFRPAGGVFLGVGSLVLLAYNERAAQKWADAKQHAERGLQALDKMPKADNVSDADFAKQKTQLSGLLNSVAGFSALQLKDYAEAQKYLRPAVEADPNNVENVYIDPTPALGSNYSITVFARRVNVNAVTAQTNDVVQ
jgi:tetratricopeptide (TPR) repeat protein